MGQSSDLSYSRMIKAFLLSNLVLGALGVPSCNTVWDEKCWDEPRQQCQAVQKPFTTTHYEQECSSIQVPHVENVPEQKCRDVPEQKCHTRYEQECATRYEQECKTEYTQKCDTVP